MRKNLHDFPESKEILPSPYELDFIRRRISGVFKDYYTPGSELEFLKLILSLSNEIAELKEEIKQIKNERNKI